MSDGHVIESDGHVTAVPTYLPTRYLGIKESDVC